MFGRIARITNLFYNLIMYKLFFKLQKTVKSVLFAIYLRKGNILHGKNQRCNYGTKERGPWHYF